MSEINSFISPEAQKQLDDYLKKISKIAQEYTKLGKASIDLQKQIKAEADAEKSLLKAKQEVEKLEQQKLKTDQELLKSETALNKAIIEEQKVIQQKIKNESEVEKLKQAKIRTAKAEEAQIKKTALAEKSLIEEYKLEIKTEKEALAQNTRLRKMRQSLDITSKSYEKRLSTINGLINKNTALTKSQADADKKRTLTIGKYKEELSGLSSNLSTVGGATGSAVSGFLAMTKASLAFIATPIGAVIGAIGLAIGALTQYFKGSEKGQNAFNKVSKIGGVILGNLSDIVIAIGEALFDAFSNPQQAISDLWEAIKTNIVNRFEGMVMQFKAIGKILKGAFDLDWDAVQEGAVEFADASIQAATGVEDAIGKITEATTELIEETEREIEVAGKLADMEAKRDLLQRKLIVDQEKLREQSRELRLKAEQAEGEERIKLLKEAFAIEDELARRRTEIAAINLQVKEEENKLNQSTKEDLDEQAELEAELYRIQQDRLKLQRTLQTQINTETEKAIALQAKQAEQYAADIDDKIAKDDEAFEAEQARLDAEVDAEIARELEKEEFDIAQDEKEKEQKNQNLQALASLTGKQVELNKAAALKQAIVDGKAAVISAYQDTPGPTPVKIAAGVLMGVQVAKNIKDIIATSSAIPAFADGVESTPSTYIAGEAGRELRVDSSGKATMVNSATLFTNDAGSTIYSNQDTEKILRGAKPDKGVDMTPVVNAIKENKAHMSVMLDRFGIISISKSGSSKTKYLNSKFRNKA